MKKEMPIPLYKKLVEARVSQIEDRVAQDYLAKKISTAQYASAMNNKEFLQGEVARELSEYITIQARE